MKTESIIFFCLLVIAIISLLFCYSEIKERNNLMADDPCEYYQKHCISWQGMESISFEELYPNNTIKLTT